MDSENRAYAHFANGTGTSDGPISNAKQAIDVRFAAREALTAHSPVDFNVDQSGSRLTVEVERAVIRDPEDALEARLRLGILTSALMEHADVLCTDVAVQQLPGATAVLQGYLQDASTLAAAMEVLARRD